MIQISVTIRIITINIKANGTIPYRSDTSNKRFKVTSTGTDDDDDDNDNDDNDDDNDDNDDANDDSTIIDRA